jgi:hypothetical protein
MEFNIKTKEQNLIIKEGMIISFQRQSLHYCYTITDVRKTPFLSRNGEFSFTLLNHRYNRPVDSKDRFKEKDIIRWISNHGELKDLNEI